MEAVLYLLALVIPDPAHLGAAQWRDREQWHRLYDNPLSALGLPPAHPDAEVNSRCRRIRAKNLKWIDREYVERVTSRDDFGRWVDEYLMRNRSVIALEDVYEAVRVSADKTNALAERWGLAGHGDAEGPCSPFYGLTFEEFKELCDYNRGVAPPPHEPAEEIDP